MAKRRTAQAGLELKGEWYIVSRDAEGFMQWTARIDNAVVTAGLTDVLSTAFAAGTQRSWYFGLISNASFTAVSSDDTMGSHAGWTEVTAYTAATRQQWTSLSVSSGVAYNPTAVVLTFNAACDIKGMFLASDSTKGGTSGILWSAGTFTSARHKLSGETISLVYRLRAAGGSA